MFTGIFVLMPLLFSLSGNGTVSAESTAQKLSNAVAQKEAAQAEVASVKEKVAALSGDVSKLSGELAELTTLNEDQKKEYAIVYAEMETALIERQATIDAYVASLENLQKRMQEYSKRMSLLMEYANKSTLEILLSSDNIACFFSQMEMVTLIGEADQQALDELGSAKDDAILKQSVAEETAAAVKIVVEEKSAILDAIKRDIDVTEANLYAARVSLSEWEEKENYLEAQSNALANEISSLQAALAAEQAKQSGGNRSLPGSGGGGVVPVGMFTWPCPGGSGSSSYGYRIHPIYGTRRFHAGTDIAAGYGSKILAAAGGTVIIADTPVAGQNTGGGGYGNFVVVDHGDGISTLYGHARDVYVSVGDYVSSGEHIADVGSTGASTGAHLHFEVRINGSTTDPMAYFS